MNEYKGNPGNINLHQTDVERIQKCQFKSKILTLIVVKFTCYERIQRESRKYQFTQQCFLSVINCDVVFKSNRSLHKLPGRLAFKSKRMILCLTGVLLSIQKRMILWLTGVFAFNSKTYDSLPDWRVCFQFKNV
jgi:hypothetical protein